VSADVRIAIPAAFSTRARAVRLFDRFYPPVLAGLLLLMTWEFVVWWFKLPNFVLPRPGEILLAATNDPQDLLHDTITTIGEAMGGYLAGSLLGLIVAIVFVAAPIMERLFMPLYVTINSVPMVAYGPLAIIWLGIGSFSKIVLILFSVSYTVLINALAGLRSCDPAAMALLRSFGAGRWTILRKLRIPAALPWIFNGLRVAVVHSMILAMVLEMLGANAGLGWSIFKSTQMMNFVEAWVAVGMSVVVSLIIYSIVTRISRWAVWW
jgi:NitT/TauT family transport system permease protein